MGEDVLIRSEGVGKKFCRDLKRSLFYGLQDIAGDLVPGMGSGSRLRKGEFWANRDINFEVRRGECLGLIGHNGAGKTTLLKMLNGLIKPDAGNIEMRGRVGALIALGAGFNPVLTGRENVYVSASVYGLSKAETDARYDEIVAFSGLEAFMETPVRSYSSGMQVRLGFAVATAFEPEILLVDEVLAVGDVEFRTKCYNRIYELVRNCAVIFVSHNMPQISRLCSRALLLANGVVESDGSTGSVINAYFNDEKLEVAGRWQIATGTQIHAVRINGEVQTRNFRIDGAGPLEVNVDVTLPGHVETLEVSLSFQDRSQELIGQANSRFMNGNLAIGEERRQISIFVPRVGLGDGKKLLSIALVDGETNEILFWARSCWEVDVVNSVFVPVPIQIEATFAQTLA